MEGRERTRGAIAMPRICSRARRAPTRPRIDSRIIVLVIRATTASPQDARSTKDPTPNNKIDRRKIETTKIGKDLMSVEAEPLNATSKIDFKFRDQL